MKRRTNDERSAQALQILTCLDGGEATTGEIAHALDETTGNVLHLLKTTLRNRVVAVGRRKGGLIWRRRATVAKHSAPSLPPDIVRMVGEADSIIIPSEVAIAVLRAHVPCSLVVDATGVVHARF